MDELDGELRNLSRRLWLGEQAVGLLECYVEPEEACKLCGMTYDVGVGDRCAAHMLIREYREKSENG